MMLFYVKESVMNIGIVGATGMVGQKIREVLAERNIVIDNLYLFASPRSAGKKISFKNRVLVVEVLNDTAFDGKDLDVLFFAAGGSISEKYVPLAIEMGIKVIDNSSNFRLDDDVLLVVPEVNGDTIQKDTKLVSNPNCSTIQSVYPLKIIDDLFGIKRVVYTTFQAVSGAGHEGVKDLETGEVNTFSRNIQKNVIPQIDVFMEDGYTKEEYKMIKETQKILGKPDLPVTATAVRVPIVNTHAISINVSCENEVDMDQMVHAFKTTPGIRYVALPDFPTAQDADGSDDVFVGRLRKDYSIDHGINLWVVADNIRKGAATNTVQILESMIKVHNN